MKFLFFPFFLLYLSGKVGVSVVKMCVEVLFFLLPLVCSLIFFSLLIIDIYLHKNKYQNRSLQTTSQALPPPIEQLQSQLKYWQELYQQQPTHRDILLNISQLYEALGNPPKSQEFAEKAREVDPNNPVFRATFSP